MNKAVAWLLIVPALLAHADDVDDADSDEAFFEFLGSFGDADEGWLDPLWLEEVELPAANEVRESSEREQDETTSDDEHES